MLSLGEGQRLEFKAKINNLEVLGKIFCGFLNTTGGYLVCGIAVQHAVPMPPQAHFCQFPSINLKWDYEYLSDLTRVDAEAIHVVIRDQDGFHLRDGDSRLPPRVRIIDLPPYSPELNPCEQLWDILKDDIGNRVFQTIEELRDATLSTLKRYWDDAAAVLRLIGRERILFQANDSKETLMSH